MFIRLKQKGRAFGKVVIDLWNSESTQEVTEIPLLSKLALDDVIHL